MDDVAALLLRHAHAEEELKRCVSYMSLVAQTVDEAAVDLGRALAGGGDGGADLSSSIDLGGKEGARQLLSLGSGEYGVLQLARHASVRLYSFKEQMASRTRLRQACALPLRSLPEAIEAQRTAQRAAAALLQEDTAEAEADMAALLQLAQRRLSELERPDAALEASAARQLGPLVDVVRSGLSSAAEGLRCAPEDPEEESQKSVRLRRVRIDEADAGMASLLADVTAEGSLASDEMCARLVEALATLERCAGQRLLLHQQRSARSKHESTPRAVPVVVGRCVLGG